MRANDLEVIQKIKAMSPEAKEIALKRNIQRVRRNVEVLRRQLCEFEGSLSLDVEDMLEYQKTCKEYIYYSELLEYFLTKM